MNQEEREAWINDAYGVPWRQSVEWVKDAPEIPCIYFITDSDHEIKYIGETKNLKRRLHGHSCEGRFVQGVDTVRYSIFSTVEMNHNDYTKHANRVFHETAYICAFKPRLNKNNSLNRVIAEYCFLEAI